MECNKDEAIRAKNIAEGKMQNNDYNGARKFALKAQRLYNNLENISQMLMICDVQCVSEKKLGMSEMDWYGILQVDQTTDDATIKQQYRKFALQLHPDKNKFPGAEVAFKLIREAQMVLLDKVKRTLHDKKCKAFAHGTNSKPAETNGTQQKTNCSPEVQINVENSFTRSKSESLSFWTMCPFCEVRYHYRRKVMNKLIPCQRCTKLFIAFELVAERAPDTTNSSERAVPQQKTMPNRNVGGKNKETFRSNNCRTEGFNVVGCSSEVGRDKMDRGRRRKILGDNNSRNVSAEHVATDRHGDLARDLKRKRENGSSYASGRPCKDSSKVETSKTEAQSAASNKIAPKGGGPVCFAETIKGSTEKAYSNEKHEAHNAFCCGNIGSN